MNRDNKFLIGGIIISSVFVSIILYFRPTDNVYTIMYYIMVSSMFIFVSKMIGWMFSTNMLMTKYQRSNQE